MLAAAFDGGADWVRLRTDERNQRSAAAILKLAGVTELPSRLEPQWIRADGTVRTSRMFAIPRPHPDYTRLPAGLPEPVDDGAAAHLPGLVLPPLTLVGTTGDRVRVDALGPCRTVLYCYPLTGRPGIALPDGWDEIPGARGCTAQACDFRDHHADLLAAGAARVYGVSSQDSDYQQEVVERLHLPFPMLADPDLALADALRMPTFRAGGARLYRRLTLIVADGVIEHVFYPVFPPNQHAGQVLRWLRSG
ncbi:peroxiredoxin [Mycobacterium sp. M1]|uniref:Peroxiredoxin n=2 Tax=Mycolicibacter acidiphilus TaxID=2835306 RepID=A0ABS5RH95_9MYCO|nr:peroxiredoxin [Mycolicibacter acidiphilus]